MDIFDTQLLEQEVVLKINDFLVNKKTDLRQNGVIINNIIREDILPLLDRFCTVIYYPTDDGQNNGFHKTYLIDGTKYHFVYINTNQDREKQIFTAAHELGHVWKLDEYLSEKLGKMIDYHYGEKIMNRFAAELLMPHDTFISFVNAELKKAEGLNSVREIIQLITIIMNEFFVPYKSVVYRLYELGFLSDSSAKALWGENPKLPKELIVEYSKRYAREQGFDRLYKPDRKKLIQGLKEDLDNARRSSKVPEQWAMAFYDLFSLNPEEPDCALSAEIDDITRGVDINAGNESSCN